MRCANDLGPAMLHQLVRAHGATLLIVVDDDARLADSGTERQLRVTATIANIHDEPVRDPRVLYGPRDKATALIARNSPKMDRVSLGASALAWPPIRDCIVELFRVTGGDTTETAQSIGRLRTFAAADPPPIPVEFWGPSEFGVCPRLLEALLEAHRGPSGPALEALDEYMRPGPRWLTFAAPTAPTVAANWTVARLREAQGNIPAALAAIRRRESNYFPAYLWTLPAFLRQEGRLAALAGDTAGALAAYDQYLVTRTDPDPPFRAQRDSVVAERSALLAR